MTTFVYHSVRKGGVAALEMTFLVKFFDERGGGATPATIPLKTSMSIVDFQDHLAHWTTLMLYHVD